MVRQISVYILDEQYDELQKSKNKSETVRKALDLYYKGEKEMKKTITSFADFQEFANRCGFDNNYTQLKWEKWFLNQEESFHYFDENDSFNVYFDGEGIYAEWEEGFVEETLREKI